MKKSVLSGSRSCVLPSEILKNDSKFRENWFSLQVKLVEADRQMVAGQLTDHEVVFVRLHERISHQ